MNPDSNKFFKRLIAEFPYEPTGGQVLLFQKLAEFLFDSRPERLFVLKGYAGTGKTSVMSVLVNNLWRIGLKNVLLAPTGRAAKVISKYSGKQAYTIHKKIYFPNKTGGGALAFTLKQNKHTRTVFIVDEASMIPDARADVHFRHNRSLLDDLFQFVYSGVQCLLILIGDTAQLPPVHLDVSPALDSALLSSRFNVKVTEIELQEVMRQHTDSGILYNATQIRNRIAARNPGQYTFKIDFPDIHRLTDADDILDALYEAYREENIENSVFILRSNKRANLYNQQIRNRILDRENEITSGDYVMIVKNNYYWLDDSETVSFIANGDICEILEILRFTELYGFRFAEAKLRMVDYPQQAPFEAVILLDTLHSDSPSLSSEEYQRFYNEVAEDYADLGAMYKIREAVRNNKYFNAFQIKFAYAMTCHKTQGGQWDSVFIEQPFLPDGPDISYIRWLYTAVTRAQQHLFLIGFKEENTDHE